MDNENAEHSGLFASLSHIWKSSLSIIKDIFSLFTLEIKLAGRSLAAIVILSVIILLLLLSSWLSLLGALVFWLLTFHISIIMTLLIMSAINLFIAIFIGILIMNKFKYLRFKETRKQLESTMRVSDESTQVTN